MRRVGCRERSRRCLSACSRAPWSNPNNSITDAAIDDVRIVVSDDDVAELRGASANPAIGTTLTYTLEAKKRANGLYVYAVSSTPGPTPIPGIGVLDLGFPFHVLAQGSLDANGKRGFGIPIPNAAVLKGLTVHSEALVFTTDAIISNPWTFEIR